MSATAFPRPGAQTRGPMKAPGPRSLPLLGNSRELLKDNLGFVMTMAREYGDIVQYRMGPVPVYQVNHPDGIQQILQDNNRKYGKGTWNFPFLRMLLGNGLVMSEGDLWLRQRRLMQPVFQHRHMVTFGDLMVRSAQKTLDRWGQVAAGGRTLDIAAEMMGLTLEIVNQALFSGRVTPETEVVRQAMSFLMEDAAFRFQLPFYPPPSVPTRRNRRFLAALATLERIIRQVISQRRELLAEGKELPPDLLTLLLQTRDEETGQEMSDRQLRDEVITLFLAGHETTALTLTWAWYVLSAHPDVERRLHAELLGVLDGRTPTVADLPALTYTRMIIDETLRLYPPAWISNRQSLADDIVCGHHIHAGSFVAFSAYVTHRHPGFWTNPEGFDPERFAPGQVQDRPRYAYFPFGGGPRQCIGKGFALVEAQLILAAIAQRCQLHLPPGHRARPQALATLRPRGGLPMTFHPRG